jgi:hypothetical protein
MCRLAPESAICPLLPVCRVPCPSTSIVVGALADPERIKSRLVERRAQPGDVCLTADCVLPKRFVVTVVLLDRSKSSIPRGDSDPPGRVDEHRHDAHAY